MATKEAIEAVEKIGGVEKKKDGELMERAPPNKEHFDSLLPAKENPTLEVLPSKQVPLLQEIQGVEGHIDLLQRKSPEEVMAQTKGVIAQIEEIKGKLNTPGLELSPAVQTVMQNKLSHIDDKLRVAVEQVGGEYQPSVAGAQEGQTLRTPLERFSGVLEASEEQLHQIFNQADAMGTNNKSFSPATMFLLQIKVAFVQQELEFFTAVLNKALESTKTLMNVQV